MLALLGAHLASRGLVSSAVARAQADGRTRAEQGAGEAVAALEVQLKAVEGRAVAASSVSNARDLVAHFDQATVLDNLQTEDVWKPFRAEFPLLGLYLDPEHAAFLGAREMHVEPLVAAAREHHLASSFWVGDGKAWLAAASVVDLAMPNGAPPAVIVLARRLDDATLTAAAHGRAVLVSDGQRPLARTAAAGPDLAAAVGSEAAGRAEGPGTAWAAASRPLGPRLWLWNLADLRGAPADAERDLRPTTTGLWGLAGLLGLVALVLGFRSPRPAPAPPVQQQPPAPPPPAPPTTTGESPPPPAWPDPFSSPPLLGGTDRTAASVARLPAALGDDDTLRRMREQGPTGTQPVVGQPLPLTAQVPAGVEGTAFGRYMLLERLGEGGMGEIFVAVAYGAENFRRLFVVKRLRAELARDRVLVGQFIDEARLGSMLVHSNIIPTYDFGKVGDEFFMAQEYILGRDMDKLTRRSLEVDGKPLPVEFVLHCARRVLEALEYAHARTDESGAPLHLVHRDVSPQNVMVSAQGEVKLFDFGIVKADSRETRTQQGVVKGNVSYMAPEQAQGLEVDRRADLYSLGLVLYRCLTGELLYREETAYKLLVRAANGPGEEEWGRVRALPAEVAALVERAIQPDRDKRFASAPEFAAALPPAQPGAQERAAALVEHLFGDELRAERARLSGKGAGTLPRVAAAPPAKS